MKEILDYIILNWEVTVLPTLVIICGIAGIIVKRTSTKKDDEVLEEIESGIQELDGIIKEAKKKGILKRKDDSTSE